MRAGAIVANRLGLVLWSHDLVVFFVLSLFGISMGPPPARLYDKKKIKLKPGRADR
jgi:hypothetical protein